MGPKLQLRQTSYRYIPSVIAFVIMLLGALVMTGWIIQNRALIQIQESFVPMQFNTALCFVLLGAGLWALLERYYNFVRYLGIVISIISVITLAQYVVGIDFYIDELLIDHYIDVNASSPGRMAPNTALCFIIIGLVYVVIPRLKPNSWVLHYCIISTAITLALALVAFTGYFNGIEASYSWGQLTHMAIHTSVGFIVISIGLASLFIERWNQAINPANISVFIAIFIISVSFTLWQAIRAHEYFLVDKQLNYYADNIQRDLNSQFKYMADDLASVKMSMNLNNLSELGTNNPTIVKRTQRLHVSSILNKNSVALAMLSKNSRAIVVYPDMGYKAVFEKFVYQQQGITHPKLVGFDNSLVAVTDVKTIGDLGHYLVVYSLLPEGTFGDDVDSDAKYIGKLIDVDALISRILLEYKNLPLDIEVVDKKGGVFSYSEGQSYDELKVTRHIVGSGWDVLVRSSLSELSHGSLANAVLVFGIIFSGLVAAISQMFLSAKRRAKLLSTEINERKVAHKKVSESKLVMELASNVSGLGVWTWDLRSNQLHWDENMYRMYHVPNSLTDHQLLYENWQEGLHPEDRDSAEKSLLQAIREKRDWYHEFRLLVKNNRIKYIKAAGTVIMDEDGIPLKMIGGNLDITELREAQERMGVLKEQADRNSLAKSQFLANMSHEIRTPMNGVLGITDLLQQTELSPLQHEYLELVKTSASALLRILNDILDHSKIEAGMLELVEEDFSLDNKVGDLLKGFAPTAHQKMIEIEYNIDANLPDCVFGDSMRVGQIIFNLVGNAIKFTETGEVIVELTASKETARLRVGDPFDLTIAIKDTGIGIPDSKLETIFEPFGQVDSTTTRRFGGTGLGLPIVRQLVHLMGGRLNVESQESIGTLMTVEIPVKVGDVKKLMSEEGHAHIVSNFDFSGITCMAVDDNAINRKWLNNMITSWGCKSIIAGSGEQALALYQASVEKQEKIDVLIVDKEMPNINGFDFIERLRSKYKDIPQAILMLTSADITEDMIKLKTLQVDKYLLKPVKQSEVFNMLTEILKVERPDLQHFEKSELAPPERLLNVLVAEDNPINSRLVHDILTYRGHNSTLVFNGKQALEQYKSGDFDVILMDVQMPEMDGLEATGLIRKFEKHRGKTPIQIIGLTAHALSGDRKICIDAGMDDYLTKPIDSTKLLVSIESILGESEPQWVAEHSAPRTTSASSQINAIDPQSPLVGANVAAVQTYTLFDIDGVMNVTSGQVDTLHAMVNMTMNILPQEIQDINDHKKANDWPVVAKQLHRMKGMLGNLTGSRLQQDFVTLESLAKDNDQAQFNRHWLSMEMKLKAFLLELQDFEDRAST